MAVFSTSGWINEWNDIIREIIFPDTILRELMMIDDSMTIMDFVDKRFVRAMYTDTVIIDEPVRIIYGTITPQQLGEFVTNNLMSFDIFVKNEHKHDVGDDRLMMRAELIAHRLNQLLGHRIYTSKGMTAYKFWCVGESVLGSATIGYSRYNITFAYNRTT